MNRIFLFIVAVFLCLPLYSEEIQIQDLLEEANLYNNTRIICSGEAVGEALKDDTGGTWVNIAQGEFNLGVYIEGNYLKDRIKSFGSYKKKGDIIKIIGTFYRNCPTHYEQDIHAIDLEVTSPGHLLKEHIPLKKELISFVLAIICLTLATVYFIRLKYIHKD